METSRVWAGWSAVTILSGASALHALWATGSSWPVETSDQLADRVVGKRPMPGPAACAAVAAALALAAATTAHATSGAPGRLAGRSRSTASLVVAALLLRGVGGVAGEVAGIGDATAEFRRWNRRLYNPLCLALAGLVAAGRGSRS
jgi:hypothetical protein